MTKPPAIIFKTSYIGLSISTILSTLFIITWLLLPFNWGIKVVGLIILLINTAYIIAKDILFALPQSWHQLRLDGNNQIIIEQKNKQAFPIKLRPNSVIGHHLTILNFKIQKPLTKTSLKEKLKYQKTHHLVLFSDSLDPVLFRKWRVWFLWHQG